MTIKNTVVLVIEDDILFYPKFVSYLTNQSGIDVVGIVIARASLKNNRSFHLLKKLRHFKINELFALLFKYSKIFITNIGLKIRNLPPCNSIISIAKNRHIPYLFVSGNINTPEAIAWTRGKKPSIIFSASPLILGSELLQIPTICINMHFSLLPAYKGIMPIFHAMADGEAVSGISLHEMTQKIDEGRIIFQREVELNYNISMFENYQNFFDLAAPCAVECIDEIKNGINNQKNDLHKQQSYFGHPDKNAWERFRARNIKFI